MAMSKKLIWLGLFVGSSVGGYLPTLFGAPWFSLWGMVGSTVGGVLGIVAGYKLGNTLGV